MKLNLLVWFILLSFSVKSQIFSLKDYFDYSDLPGVSVLKNGKFVGITNNKGEIKIKFLKKSDTLTFTLLGYEEKKVVVGNICPIIGSDNNKCYIFLLPKTESLKEVVVSASKFYEVKEDIPIEITVLSSKEIFFTNPQNTSDVFQKSGELFVQKSQQGGGSPIIRGFEANKILLMMDGIRMNNAIYRGGHLQNIIMTDPNSMKRIEVVYGPGSVIYGSDALGGVIHMHTFTPMFSDTAGELLVSGNVTSRYTTADYASMNSVRMNIGGKKIAYVGMLTFSNFGDLRQGNIRNPFYEDWGKRFYYVARVNGRDTMISNSDVNLQTPSGYSQVNTINKLSLKTKNTVHTLSFYFTTSTDIPRYDRLNTYKNQDTLKYAEWYYGPQKWLVIAYNPEFKNKNFFYDKAKIGLSYQYYLESRHTRKFAEREKTNRFEQLDILGINTDFQKEFLGLEMRYGIEYYRNFVNSTAFISFLDTTIKLPTTTRYPDGGSFTDNSGLYLSISREIGNHFVLNAGGRFNYNALNAKFADTSLTHFPFTEISNENTAFTGNIGAVFKTKSGRVAIDFSSGYRSPNIDDISKVFDSQPGYVVVPNPNLKCERTYTADLIIEKSFIKTIFLTLNSFYTAYTDAITLSPFTFNGNDSIMYDGEMSRVLSNQNNKEAYIYGISGKMLIYMSKNFKIKSSLTYTYGRIKTDSIPYPLDHVPPIYGKTSLMYSTNFLNAEFYLLYNGWKRKEDYNLYGEDKFKYATIYGTPAWVTLNANVTFRPLKSLGITVGVENITDVNYRLFASGISAPGRNLIVKINGWF